jgi:hypothetical protein
MLGVEKRRYAMLKPWKEDGATVAQRARIEASHSYCIVADRAMNCIDLWHGESELTVLSIY